jgi:hypothetical protein
MPSGDGGHRASAAGAPRALVKRDCGVRHRGRGPRERRAGDRNGERKRRTTTLEWSCAESFRAGGMSAVHGQMPRGRRVKRTVFASQCTSISFNSLDRVYHAVVEPQPPATLGRSDWQKAQSGVRSPVCFGIHHAPYMSRDKQPRLAQGCSVSCCLGLLWIHSLGTVRCLVLIHSELCFNCY